jgi:hypothetical protein
MPIKLGRGQIPGKPEMSSSDKEITSKADGKSAADKSNTSCAKPSGSELGPPGQSATTKPSDSVTAPELTTEEQMALYEKELKETDWGHQPC